LADKRWWLIGIEPFAVVDDLDREHAGPADVGDLDVPGALGGGIRVAYGVRDGLGERELQVCHRLLADGAGRPEPAQGEPAERHVLGPGRNAEEDSRG